MKGKKITPPDDMERILTDWSHILHHWNEKVDELIIYKRFFRSSNKAAVGKVQKESNRLIRRLQKLV